MRAQALSQRAGLQGRRPSGREPQGVSRCSSAMARHHWASNARRAAQMAVPLHVMNC
jgi:hypothetical protein